uniref:Aminopeptidase n=1 Tax=Macrostomum lignano TaxID=282301 RepID=A0A1I8IMR1_9PLAT
MSKPFERLPTHSKPVNYNLTLTPNLNDFTFKGEQVITVQVIEPTKTLVLNSAEIEIQSAKFNDASAEISFNTEEETVKFSFPSELPVGEGKLSMSFTGILNDRMKGFYRSKYTDSDGNEIRCAVTQFEPTDARRSLPCWDEPELKATFDVTLVVDKNLTAVSNMLEVSRTEVADGLVAVKFDRTPIMSTYLLAYVVGKFDYVEGRDADFIKMRVFTPIGKKDQGLFALEVAKKTLPFYRKFFNVAYPLPKLDLIAIPDFAAGAMENWGLVTYRETALLVDADNSSAATKEWVALVVGHELAHQWFGNLVTMKWWTDLWLNEGFASWIEYLCVDHCYPEFDIWTRFVQSDLSRALELDALENSHPIQVENKFANASTENLWEALADASGQPVQFVMEGWTKQMGYPVISVASKPAEGDDSKLELTITQEKFQLGGANKSDLLWRVPIQVLTATGHKHQLMLAEKSDSFTVPKAAWVKLNPGCIGVYRVDYSASMLQDLIAALKHGQLSQRDRFNLENDLFALAAAGRVPIVQVLQLADAYKAEQFYTVWSDLLSNLGSVQVLADHLGLLDKWRAFLRQLCEPAYQRLGWDARPADGHDATLLRSVLIGCLGRAGHESVLAEAKAKFAKHCSGECPITPDLRACVYSTVLANGGVEEFEAVLKLLEKTDMQEEKPRPGAGRQRQGPSLQDTVFFVKSRWSWFVEKFAGQFLLSRLVQLLCNDFCTAEDADDVDAFFKANPAPRSRPRPQK